MTSDRTSAEHSDSRQPSHAPSGLRRKIRRPTWHRVDSRVGRAYSSDHQITCSLWIRHQIPRPPSRPPVWCSSTDWSKATPPNTTGGFMSSLDYTYENLDKVVPRSNFLAPTIDPKKTMLLVLDMQKACAEVGGAMYIESVGGAPEGKDVVEPVQNVLAACRAKGIPVVWSLWGLRPDGADAGFADVKWGLTGQLKEWPGSWGNGGDELVDGLEPAEGEPVMRKHRFSSFYHTPLNEYMRRAGADTLVVAGLSTGNCQLATAIDGANQDYKIIVLADTTAAIPSGLDDPLGYGQHWESLRQIQANHGDVRTSK
ncbi:MAG: cysteine hydrolase, partial [Alphaproteobacteria bacterium]